MRQIEWWLDVGINGADRKGVIEVEDDATDAQIQQEVRDTVFNYIEWGWTDPETTAEGAGLEQ